MKGSKPADSTKALENGQAVQPDSPHYRLRLFVSGSTPKSAPAIQNIRALCEERLQGRYDLEVIDIYQHPEQIKQEQIVVTPTLVKKLPLPIRKIVGDLSDKQRVLVGLDLVRRGPPATPPKGGHGA